MCYRTWALSHAGYCEACEWMTYDQVQRYTLMTPQTIRAYEFRNQWHTARIGSRVLVNRADVETTRAQRIQDKRAWVSITLGAA